LALVAGGAKLPISLEGSGTGGWWRWTRSRRSGRSNTAFRRLEATYRGALETAYLLLQHEFLHWELLVQNAQSPSEACRCRPEAASSSASEAFAVSTPRSPGTFMSAASAFMLSTEASRSVAARRRFILEEESFGFGLAV